MKETETYNFILIQKDGTEAKPLPIHGNLVEAEVLALHLLRPGETLCAVEPGTETPVVRWEAAASGKIIRTAQAA